MYIIVLIWMLLCIIGLALLKYVNLLLLSAKTPKSIKTLPEVL